MSDAYIETSYEGPVGFQHRCPLCTATGPELLKCAGCHAARYCSREHQKPAPRRPGKSISSTTPPKTTAPPLTPSRRPSTFGCYRNTRDYMVARMRLAESYLLRPGSLDCDQDCYAFVKWWATCDPHGKYNWMDTTLPHLDLHGADVFEDPGFVMVGLPGLNHLVAILLLKLKLLIDVRKILRHHSDGSPLGTLRSPISAGLLEKGEQSLTAIKDTLLSQIIKLVSAINKTNKHFIADLAKPNKALISMPENYMMGSPEESALAVQSSYAAFWATEGALETLKKIQDLKPTND